MFVTLDDINVNSPLVTPSQAHLIRALSATRLQMLSQGRGREATKYGTALICIWQQLTSPDIDITFPDSVVGEL